MSYFHEHRRLKAFCRQANPAMGDECWVWSGCNDKDGYGLLGRGRAHRISWELFHGDIPDGLFICHRCDNPPCVNPAHLFIGSLLENNRDRAHKGRTRYQSGSYNSMAELTEAQVTEMRYRYSKGEETQDLAAEYGVCQETASMAIIGATWKHLPNAQPPYRRYHFLTIAGRTQCLKDWAKELGKSYHAISQRIHRGMSPREALFKPFRAPRPRKIVGVEP